MIKILYKSIYTSLVRDSRSRIYITEPEWFPLDEGVDKSRRELRFMKEIPLSQFLKDFGFRPKRVDTLAIFSYMA